MSNDMLPDNKNDLYRLIICIVVIIAGALLVGIGKVQNSEVMIIIVSIISYYLGKTSDKG